MSLHMLYTKEKISLTGSSHIRQLMQFLNKNCTTKHGCRDSTAKPGRLAKILKAYFQTALNPNNNDGDLKFPRQRDIRCQQWKHENEPIRQQSPTQATKIKAKKFARKNQPSKWSEAIPFSKLVLAQQIKTQQNQPRHWRAKTKAAKNKLRQTKRWD